MLIYSGSSFLSHTQVRSDTLNFSTLYNITTYYLYYNIRTEMHLIKKKKTILCYDTFKTTYMHVSSEIAYTKCRVTKNC